MFRINRLTLASILLAVSTVATASPLIEQIPAPLRSATKARDIGGFVLGMNIRDAAKMAKLDNIGNGGFQARRDGIDYDFGVTQLGRIYRIDSSQQLGRFDADDVFIRQLSAKLTAKYGPTASNIAGTLNWELIEPVKRTGGAVLPFKTNWASAYFDDGLDGVTLHIKLIDFRVMWRDDAQVNRGPRDNAVNEIAL